jgi:hypothetical protein
MRRAMITGAAILAAMIPGACGEDDSISSEDEAQIDQVVETVEAAINDKNRVAFCEALAPSYVEGLGGQGKCVEGFKTDILFLAKGERAAMELEDVEAEGDGAVVTLTNGFTINVVKEDGVWYFEPFAPPAGASPAPDPIADPSDLPTTPPEN